MLGKVFSGTDLSGASAADTTKSSNEPKSAF